MARELVLIPKTKYEHLLKRVEEYNQLERGKEEQTGGQLENSEVISSIGGDKPEINMSTGNERNSADDKETKRSIEDAKLTKLYVDKPLSKMPFSRIALTSPDNKKKIGVKTNVHKGLFNDDKKRSDKKKSEITNSNGKKRNQYKDRKKSAKMRWVNYII